MLSKDIYLDIEYISFLIEKNHHVIDLNNRLMINNDIHQSKKKIIESFDIKEYLP